MSVIKALEKAFITKEKRNWDCIYVAVDLHDTVVYSNYSAETIPTKFYPYAKETLQILSNIEDIKLIMWTCSHPKEIEQYVEFFKGEGITFDFINKNPDVATDLQGYGCYDDKFYVNCICDDKAGFDGENDWKAMNELICKKYDVIVLFKKTILKTGVDFIDELLDEGDNKAIIEMALNTGRTNLMCKIASNLKGKTLFINTDMELSELMVRTLKCHMGLSMGRDLPKGFNIGDYSKDNGLDIHFRNILDDYEFDKNFYVGFDNIIIDAPFLTKTNLKKIIDKIPDTKKIIVTKQPLLRLDTNILTNQEFDTIFHIDVDKQKNLATITRKKRFGDSRRINGVIFNNQALDFRIDKYARAN